MGMYDDDGDDYRGEDSKLVKDLRAQIEKLSKADKEKAEKLAVYENRERTQTIETVLAARGVNPRIAKFMPSDIEVSEQAVASWLDENADIFGVQPVAAEQEQQAPPPEADPFRRMAALEQSAQPPVSMDDLSQVDQMSGAELWAALGGR